MADDMPKEEKEKEIRCDIVKGLSETEGYRGRKMRLQIVKWNGRKATLEKREYWFDENEQKEKPSKAKGLTLDDFHTLLANQEEIDKLLAN